MALHRLLLRPAARLAVAALLAAGLALAVAVGAAGAGPAPETAGATVVGAAAEATPPTAHFHRAVAPHVHLARQAARRGEWPLWNDRAGAGYPLLGTAGGQLLHPFTWLLYPLPAAAWLPLLAWLRIATGLGLAAWLLRRLGARPGEALAGGAVYAAAVAVLAALPAGTYAALAPSLLLAAALQAPRDGLGSGPAEWARKYGDPFRQAAPFLALAALFAAGDPPAVVLGAVFASAFLLAQAAPLPPAERRRRLGGWSARGVLAALVTAPILVTTFRWSPQTYPARHFTRQRSARLTGDPLELERGLGMTSQAADLDLLRGPEPAWAAALALALVLLAATAWWLGQRRRRNGPADGTGAGAGPSIPVPFFAALGLAAWLEVARPPVVSSLLEYYHLPPAADLAVAPGLPWLLLALVALATAVAHHLRSRGGAGAGKPTSPPRQRRRLLALGAVTALLLTLVPVLRAPAAPEHPEVMARLQALLRDTGYSRVAPLGPLVAPESLARHGLSDVRGHLPYLPAAYVDVVQWLMPPASAKAGAVRDREACVLTVPHSPLYRLLGGRWKVTPPWPAMGAPEAAAPGRPVAHLADASLFESIDALPPLFLPRQVRTRPAPHGWVDWVRKNRDFGHRSLASPPRRELGPARTPGRTGQDDLLRIEKIHATRLRATLDVHRRRLVASSVYQDGGWHALTGAPGAALEPVPTSLANGPFVAVWVPPGRHSLELLYRPPGFAAALAAGALGLALALTLLLPAPRRLRAEGRP